MAGGIAPKLLCEQVENTASWALEGPTDGPALSWRRALREGRELEPVWTEPEQRVRYFELMLSAHYATVATFVPTDVDTRIRFHAWQEVRERSQFEAMVALVDHAAAHWSAPAVSARTVDVGLGPLSGHDGEWFSVRAGALGRAIHLRFDEMVERLSTAIDQELDRERESFERAIRTKGRELDALRCACVIAHNLGDLSRVVVDWVAKGSVAETYVTRYARLGHDDATNTVKTFRLAGAVNKAVMALENHRFLPLRKPRALRKSRALLLPMGPFFDAWGAAVAKDPSIDRQGRAEVLSALIDAHESDPTQQGYLRAMAGVHGATRGGIDELAKELPAKQRRAVSGGAVREALGVSQERFEARMVNRLKQAVAGAVR
ncbi:MAG: hypothetical protein JNK05_31225 [Myxococcales bacterium]|nr:hypothetical protein [Myxococcales bacterium]